MSGRITLNLDRGTDFRLDVSFEIPDKGITVLFGPSGCGKTTVLRCTAGLERAGGRVVVADRVWQDDARNIFVPAWERRLGYVFQEASLFEHLNVEGNLHFGLRHKDARGGSPASRKQWSSWASGIFSGAACSFSPAANAREWPSRVRC